MKKLIIASATLALVAGVGLMKAEAATSDVVTVTVTLATVSVSVSPDAWALTDVVGVVTSGTYTATNDCIMTSSETLTIQCGAGATWTISATAAGANEFVMKAQGGDLTEATEIATAQILETPVAQGEFVNFTLEFTPPASSTVASDSMDVTVTATAA